LRRPRPGRPRVLRDAEESAVLGPRARLTCVGLGELERHIRVAVVESVGVQGNRLFGLQVYRVNAVEECRPDSGDGQYLQALGVDLEDVDS